MARSTGRPTPLRTGPRLVPNPLTRPTIEQVATQAGVSVATVSRALRGLANVAPTTRARVANVAREIGYRPDPAAARLASGRSRTIGVVVPILNSWYFANVVAGIEAVCAADGYDLLVVCQPSADSVAGPGSPAHSLERRVDGLIYVDVRLRTEDVALLAVAGIDVVTIGQRVGPFSSVWIDDERIGSLATEHLLSLGHRRIGVIGVDDGFPGVFDVPSRRLTGIREALAAHRVVVEPLLMETGEFTVDGGAEAARRLLGLPQPPSALIALSDEMAFGAIGAIRDAGGAVPDDVSVIGVDDHDASVAFGLTTIRQDVTDHGALAARALLSHLGDGGHDTVRLPGRFQLVVRSTTARAHP
ncbi:MAG: LacI family DNA-binding transcriptional regulator [Desertimonas sp.]